MAATSTVIVLIFSLVLFSQALEKPSSRGGRSKRDIMASFFNSPDKRLSALEANTDNSTEERLAARLEAKMEEEVQEKLQGVTQRLESMVLELLSSRLESMVTEILTSKLKVSEEKVAELVEAKTNATEERLASLEASNTEAQASPGTCRYQYLYQYEKESPHSSGNHYLGTQVEAELTRLQEQVSALNETLQDGELRTESLHNASVLALEGVVHTVTALMAASESKLQSTMQNATKVMASMLSSSEAQMLASTVNNTVTLTRLEQSTRELTTRMSAVEDMMQSGMEEMTAATLAMSTKQNATMNLASMINVSMTLLRAQAENKAAMIQASIAQVDKTSKNLGTRMSTVEDTMQSGVEEMTAATLAMSTTQNATRNLASVINVSMTQLRAQAEFKAAMFQASIAQVDKTSKDLGMRMSAVENKIDNASLLRAREMESTKAKLEDIKRTTEELRAPLRYRRTCQDYYDDGSRTSGIYKLQLHYAESLMEVYCEMKNGSGWVVFQRRFNGSVNFYQNWNTYQKGFGSLRGEFWLGNINIHRLTSAGLTHLKVDLQAWNYLYSRTAYATYSHFSVGDARTSYTLSVSGYSGNAGDSLTYHSGYMFSTYDQDNDVSKTHCARDYNYGGWWYNNCDYSNLNGKYGQWGQSGDQYMNWYHWLEEESLQKTEMKLK